MLLVNGCCWGSYCGGASATRAASGSGSPGRQFMYWVFLYMCVCLSVCFVLINLVIAFSPKCVTNSMFKESFMSTQMHHFGWLSFICSILSVIV
jgi:uncharacterized membrane protein